MSFPPYHSYKDSGVEWLGQVPNHWEVVRNKAILHEVDDRSETGDEELLTVSHLTGVTKRSEKTVNMTMAETLVGYKECRRFDLAINTMWGWMGALGVSWCDGIVSPSYNVYRFRASASINPRYYDYLCRMPAHVTAVKANSTGVWESRLRIYPDTFLSMRVAAPPVREQDAIVSFLDRETAKIDVLVDEQRRLIELLKEKRQAVISHAVTKGLDPHAPMKDSGVEWLGQVPEHWEVKQLAHLTRPGTLITYGIVQAGPDIEGGVPYIRTSDMAGDSLPTEGLLRTSPEIDAAYARSRVATGDVVIAIRATIGKPLIVPSYLDGANLTQGTAKFSPRQDIRAEYICHFLRSSGAVDEFARLGKGATFKEITLEMLRKFRVLQPPLAEQQQIIDFLQRETFAIDGLLAQSERAIALLQERRTALISAAVTGKIDVRGAAPAAAEAA